MPTLQQIVAGAGADTRVNENFAQVSPAALFARNPVTTTGLTWGYKGGQYSGSTIADGTVALTLSATNYIVADRSTGAVSAATTTTNWLSPNYIQLYQAVCGVSTVTSYTDYRQLIGGVGLGTANVFTKNQSVAPITASVTGTYTPDAATSNNFQLTLTGALTLANPTNLTAGMVLNFCLDEDGSGAHSIGFGSMYKWPGGTVPTWVTTASAKNFFSGYYDGTIIRCGGGAGYA